MKFRINNVLIRCVLFLSTKLMELSEEKALKLVETVIINGREGFFLHQSSQDFDTSKRLLANL